MIRVTSKESLGFCLLLSVIVIWVASGFFIQALFTTTYNHPVATTVFSVALCSILLLVPDNFHRPNDEPLLPKTARGRGPATMPFWQICLLGLIWLTAQLTYNVSLKYMSVSSNTAVSSLSSVFTFAFSVLLLKRHSFTALAVTAVALSTVGILLISTAQPTGDGVQESHKGFALAGVSCCCYGLFTTLLKKYNKTSVITLFGYFGLIACVIGPILVALADATAVDPFAWPADIFSVAGIFLNALLGSVLSDILLAKSVMLLSPLTVSVGLSLTMPLSLFVDAVVLKNHQFKTVYAAGLVAVFSSVCLVSIDNHKQRSRL